MCMSKVITTYAKPSDLIVDGWKEFGSKGGVLMFPNMGGIVEMNKWTQADKHKAPDGVRASDGQMYMAGFHAYADETEVKRLNTRRVYLRLISCLGEQDGKKCVIAQEIYVPSNPDAWPPQLPTPPSISPAKKSLINRIKGKP